MVGGRDREGGARVKSLERQRGRGVLGLMLVTSHELQCVKLAQQEDII